MGLACKPLAFSESRLPPCAMGGSPVFLLGAGQQIHPGDVHSVTAPFSSVWAGAQSAWTLAPGLLSTHFHIRELQWLLSLPKRTFPVLGQLVVYGKRVGRREGKLATIWLGGRALFWIGAGHESLVMSGGLTASLRGC